MLLFIRGQVRNNNRKRKFQNISCYCLSITLTWQSSGQKYFKTSHVIVYHLHQVQSDRHCRYFKTSHVIVYQLLLQLFPRYTQISKHLMLLFIVWYDGKLDNLIVFQNISCYCLSCRPLHQIVFSQLFQNISCYCLSLIDA